MCGRNYLGQLVDDGVMGCTTASHLLAYHLSRIKRNIVGIQSEVGKQVLIYFLHLRRPILLTCIGLALEHEHSLDYSLLLGNLGQFDETGVWIVVVVLGHILHPLWLLLKIRSIVLLVEEFDSATTNGDINHSHLDILRQTLHHLPAEIVGGCQTSVGATKGRNGSVPLSLFPSQLGIIHRSHRHESRVHSLHVLLLITGITLHIRLSETEVNVEILILRLHCHNRPKRHKSEK